MNFDRFRWPLIIWVSYHLTEFFFFKFKTYHYFIIFQNFWISAHRALTLQAQSRFWKRVHTEIYKFYQNFIIWLSWFLLKNTLIIWASYFFRAFGAVLSYKNVFFWSSLNQGNVYFFWWITKNAQIYWTLGGHISMLRRSFKIISTVFERFTTRYFNPVNF